MMGDQQASFQRAIMIGVLSAVTVFVLFELVDYFYGRYAAHQAPDMIRQSAEYLGAHDAATNFLQTLKDGLDQRG